MRAVALLSTFTYIGHGFRGKELLLRQSQSDLRPCANERPLQELKSVLLAFQATAANSPVLPQGRNQNGNVRLSAVDDAPSVHAALIDPKRLSALRKCDSATKTYDPKRFFETVFDLTGRNERMLIPALAFFFTWGAAGLLCMARYPWLKTFFSEFQVITNSLLSPVSFLIVFRCGRSSIRFWDARAALGKLIERCRTASSLAVTAGGKCPELRDAFLRWLAIVPIAVKQSLRECEKDDLIREIVPLVSRDEAVTIVEKKFSPIYVLNRLRNLAYRIAIADRSVDTEIRGQTLRALNNQIDELTVAFGAMQRIQLTPLPFIWVAHLRTIIVTYLSFFYLTTLANYGWRMLPGLLISSWALLGLEAAAVEVENPFLRNMNHLLLGDSSVVVAETLAQSLMDASSIAKDD